MENEHNLPDKGDICSQSITPDAAIVKEASQAGIAFGDLLQTTGVAVQETQNRLTIQSSRNANTLSDTMMDVMAVQENIYDDEGNLVKTHTHSRKLPLVNFIDPVFYDFSGIRLQGEYTINELATASEGRQNNWISEEKIGQRGIHVIFGEERHTVDSGRVESDRDLPEDFTSGHLRISTQLKARKDISFPKPKLVIRGPKLSIIQGEIIDLRDSGIGPITSRTLSVIIEYRHLDGTPIENKTISIDTKGASWQYAGRDRTNGEGQIEILLTRTFLDERVNTAPAEVILSARIGLIENQTTVIF